MASELARSDIERFSDLPESIEAQTGGRPLGYSRDRAIGVLARLEAGESIESVEDATGSRYPSWELWAAHSPAFGEALTRARKAMAQKHASKAVTIPDAVEPDSPYGNARVSKARLQVESHRWLAGCLDRPTWGDRTQVEHSGAVGLVTAFFDMARLVPNEGTSEAGELPHVAVPDGGE